MTVGRTTRPLVWAARAGVRRVILATSSAADGAHPEVRTRESHRLDPCWPHAASKLAGQKHDGDLGRPNLFVMIDEEGFAVRKVLL